VVSLLIAVLILQGAFQLLVECTDVLLESVPSRIDLTHLRKDLQTVPGVLDVHDLHVWSLASGVVALSAHLRTKEGASAAEILQTSTQLLHDTHGIEHATLQLEPESYSHEDTHLNCQKPG
jgi:cobalt-zinc-cadmium efflux system protein